MRISPISANFWKETKALTCPLVLYTTGESAGRPSRADPAAERNRSRQDHRQHLVRRLRAQGRAAERHQNEPGRSGRPRPKGHGLPHRSGRARRSRSIIKDSQDTAKEVQTELRELSKIENIGKKNKLFDEGRKRLRDKAGQYKKKIIKKLPRRIFMHIRAI